MPEEVTIEKLARSYLDELYSQPREKLQKEYTGTLPNGVEKVAFLNVSNAAGTVDLYEMRVIFKDNIDFTTAKGAAERMGYLAEVSYRNGMESLDIYKKPLFGRQIKEKNFLLGMSSRESGDSNEAWLIVLDARTNNPHYERDARLWETYRKMRYGSE